MASDPDLGKIGPGHVCKHGVRWPHACVPCDEAAWAMEKSRREHSPPNPLPIAHEDREAALVEKVARALCQVHDKQERADGRRGGALIAYDAGSFAVPFWDEMARVAISAAIEEAANIVAEHRRRQSELKAPADRQTAYLEAAEDAIRSLAQGEG